MTRSLRKPSELSDSVHQQLNMYVVAASAAGVGMMALAQSAEAKIVYTPAHVQLKDGYFLDFNHDGVNDFYFFYYGTNVTSTVWLKMRLLQVPGYTPPLAIASHNGSCNRGGRGPAALRAGVRVGPGQSFGAANSVMASSKIVDGSKHFYYCSWENKGKGRTNRFLGLKFPINNVFHYGWARITLHSPSNAILTGYAYETVAKKAIVTGKTKGPDVITVHPGSLGRLAQGSAARSGR